MLVAVGWGSSDGGTPIASLASLKDTGGWDMIAVAALFGRRYR